MTTQLQFIIIVIIITTVIKVYFSVHRETRDEFRVWILFYDDPLVRGIDIDIDIDIGL